MITQEKNKASILVNVTMFGQGSEQIPKYVQVFDNTLTAIRSFWIQERSFAIDELDEGIYIIRLTLSSGVQKTSTLQLKSGERKQLSIDISNNSPHESHEWAYFTKKFSSDAFRDTNLKMMPYDISKQKLISGKLWHCQYNFWTSDPLPQMMNQVIQEDGNTYDLSTEARVTVLEISGDDMPNLFTSLPPASNVKCLVKLSDCNDQQVHPIDVTVSTDNKKSETLLTLLTTGAIRQAQSLEAEELLYSKMENPIAAAIGGYYLLKVGELKRLHDWANNLANWFSWMPDGAIIHAWQMMSEPNMTDALARRIRERLLEAHRRGLPIYTEGLRLLHDGLSQLWYYFKNNDDEIKTALSQVSKYVEVADWSQETTTFIGISPDQPGRKNQKAASSPVVKATDDLTNRNVEEPALA